MNRRWLLIGFLTVSLILLLSCSKDKPTGTAQVPTLTTGAVTAVTRTTAQCGGTIISDGGETVIARGVCWSTNLTPTVGDSRTSNGTGAGSFTSSITDLVGGTPYYVRAYATTGRGTGYGSAMSFTTLPEAQVPTVTTARVSGITPTTSVCGGKITSNGGEPVYFQGVCWSTNPIPTIPSYSDGTGERSPYSTRDVAGNGIFGSSITDLFPGTRYYVRAYATNSRGTGYGSAMSFTTTGSSSGTVVDIDGNVYRIVIIGAQVWMAENLKVTHYRNGEAIPRVNCDTLGDATTGAYGIAFEDVSRVTDYGLWYNWYSVSDNRNIAPVGWHVPTDAEWQTLVNSLGGDAVAGEKMKGGTLWCGTNESGFCAFPGRRLCVSGGLTGNFWSSTGGPGAAWGRQLVYYCPSYVYRDSYGTGNGLSVRCVKD